MGKEKRLWLFILEKGHNSDPENCECHDGEVEKFPKVSSNRGIRVEMVKISGNRSILMKEKVFHLVCVIRRPFIYIN